MGSPEPTWATGRIGSVLVGLAWLALATAFVNAATGPIFLLAAHICLYMGLALGLLDDYRRGSLNRERLVIGMILVFCLVIFAKPIAAAAPIGGLR